MPYGARAIDDPEWFKYSGPILSRFEIYPLLTGSALSSHDTNWYFHPIVFPEAVAFSDIVVAKSMNGAVPAGTGLASTGSEGYTYKHGVSIFKRQDYGANSSNLSCVATASGGITATMGYSSTSQQFGMSWLTNASGGTSAYTTTSNAANWSSFVTGAKLLTIPVSSGVVGSGMTLSAGEYFIAHQHSSTTATSNSNVTLLSFSNYYVAPQALTFGVLGGSASVPYVNQMGGGLGVASAVTTNATMASSVISASVQHQWLQNLSNV